MLVILAAEHAVAALVHHCVLQDRTRAIRAQPNKAFWGSYGLFYNSRRTRSAKGEVRASYPLLRGQNRIKKTTTQTTPQPIQVMFG